MTERSAAAAEVGDGVAAASREDGSARAETEVVSARTEGEGVEPGQGGEAAEAGEPGTVGSARATRRRIRVGSVARAAALAPVRLPRWVGRLLLGPIFQREVLGAGRRRGPYALRFLYAAVLLTVVSLAFAGSWSSMRMHPSSVAMAQSLQQVAPAITFIIGWFMLLAMAIVGPALTGGAIADEKRARTLPALMTTPLSSLQIVVGKLSARTVQIVILALLGAPLLLAMRLFGGVPAAAVAGTMSIALSVALLGAALGIMCSIWHRRGTSAMGFAIMLLGTASFGPLLVWGAATRFNGIPPDLVLGTCAVFVMIGLQGGDPTMGSTITLTVAGQAVAMPLWMVNVAYHLVVMCAAIAVATVSLRRVMVAEASGAGADVVSQAVKRLRLGGRGRVAWWIGSLLVVVAALGVGFVAGEERGLATGLAYSAGTALVGIALLGLGVLVVRGVGKVVPGRGAGRDAAAGAAAGAAGPAGNARTSRDVGDAPVLWRELRQSSFDTRRKLVVSLLAAVGIPAFLWIRFEPHEPTIHWLIVMVCLLGVMLQAAVMTTSAVGAERESGSWETLLTTPLSARAILGGKMAGALRRLWLLPGVAAADLLLVAVCGWAPWMLVAQFVIIAAGPIVLLSAGGVLMSLLFRKPTVAAVWNLSCALALWIGTWIALALANGLTLGSSELLDMLMTLNYINSPPGMMGTALDGGMTEWNRGSYDIGAWHSVSAGMFTLVAVVTSGVQCAVAAGVLGFAAGRFNRLTGRSS